MRRPRLIILFILAMTCQAICFGYTNPFAQEVMRLRPDSILSQNGGDASYSSEADSLAIPTYNLDEIVIEAPRQSRIKDGMAYFPDKDVKKFSTDGISLLSRLAIPGLIVNPLKGSVEAIDQSDIAFFINGMPANRDDIDALAPSEVNKIEVLEHPTDVKYMGAQMAINYVVRKYVMGGYTKINGYASLPYQSYSGYLYSGFNYKDMTYTLYVQPSFSKFFNQSVSKVNTVIGDRTYNIISESDKPNGHSTGENAYFAIQYQTKKMVFKSKFALVHSLTPWSSTYGTVDYSVLEDIGVEGFPINTSSEIGSHQVRLNPQWSGNFRISLSPTTLFLINASTLFWINKSTHSQSEWMNEDLILQNDYKAKETGNQSRLGIGFSKEFNGGHSLSIMGNGYYDLYNLSYTGDTQSFNRLKTATGSLIATYTYAWTKGRVSAYGGASYLHSSVQGSESKYNKVLPLGNVSLIWNPKYSQQLNLNLMYATGSYPLSQSDPTLIRRNLLIWEQGNPDLKFVPTFRTDISYRWWNSHVSIFGFGSCQIDNNNLYPVAYENETGDGLIVSFKNGCRWITSYVGLGITWFITKELTVNGSGKVLHFYKEDPYKQNKVRVDGNFNIQWAHKFFSIYAAISSPNNYESYNGFSRTVYTCGLGVNFAVKNWNIGVQWDNFQNYNNHKQRESWGNTQEGKYSFNTKDLSDLALSRVNLSVTYTIRYGKKQQEQQMEGVTKDESLLK